ncbi:protein-serine/threonine phosphatase [Calothrix sp. NIES-2100]|nr:protein-serine/threonine phosphatase [Calothrix sp. NIES-2100]
MAWASGEKLYGARYIVEKKLGEGGLGVTYLAKNKKGSRIVIKTLRDEMLADSRIDWYREKFLEEIIQLSNCRHTNIVQIEDFFKERNLPCMVMEYIEGEDLEKLVTNQGILREAEALRYIWQIGEALTVVHEKGLLHRDIKPSNIMVRSTNSEAILIDFGLARGFIPDFTQQLTVGLTHGFAPPEQYFEEGRWGEYTDVYALAATLYYLLTKTRPIAAPYRALNAPFKQPQQINSRISDRVNQAIWQGMALEATKRPQRIQDWLDLYRRSQQEILLLEKPPVVVDSRRQQVQLCPDLITAWGNANSMRQLHWLWQLANLWQPLLSEGVATSLLKPDLIRVEGTLVRLLELHSDSETTPSLSELGKLWQQLPKAAKPAIAEFIQNITSSLISQEINSAEQLIAVLDQGLAQLGRSQTSTIKIFTKTDTGPSCQRNEDACYPLSGTLVTKPPQFITFAIVCDGMSEQEGGRVASAFAIETIQQQLQQLAKVPPEHIDPSLLLNDLESAVAIANDKISQRNDYENRQGHQRMGTTLVMALPIAHEMYITHVGDSRAYWITRQGCYQVTLDDDVASREVRLGYSIYREAVQQSGSGSLVQALGMSSSTSLHPTSQRFILDEDAVFLLTSDGLSDFDRIEDYWETEILPILNAGTDVASVAERLVEIANTKNGHDNVTIALVHYQVKYTEPEVVVNAVIPESFSTTAFSPTISIKTSKVSSKPKWWPF